jgi:hypothetical protein
MAATVTQLDPPLPVTVEIDTIKYKALAHMMIDYGIEHDLMWVVFLDNNGECWTIRNRDLRAQKNETIGRKL